MELLELGRLMVKWIVDRPSRLVLLGYRPEVICLIRGTAEPASYLLIRSHAHRTQWAPPQEGMHANEDIESTVDRCLLHELGIEKSRVQYRKNVWIGTRILPRQRWDERELRYSLRGVLGKPRMIGKGYYASLVIADSNVRIDPNPAEVYDWTWAKNSELHILIETNPPDKKHILEQAWSLLSYPG